jgi:hypothetical protein
MVTRAALTDQFARVNGRPIINKRKKAIKILEVPAAGSTLSERFGLVTVQLEGDRGTPHGDSGLFFSPRPQHDSIFKERLDYVVSME